MLKFPSRTLTFLFTDIEGSSRLWDKYPDAMRVAVARHDAILREVIETQRGQVVKTTGDGVHAVFAIAQDAVVSCLHAQRALQSENWDEHTPIRVRMGMHTGTSEERDGDYYGPVLNRTARLMAVGSGGQVLLSKTTYELARDHLPREISFRDLGEHRLRDLSRPEHIYQLIAPTLPLDFPALKTLEAHPNNLPIQLTNFIGREKEIAHVEEALSNARLVTLTGVGGAGKTRLALQVAAELLETFPEGVWVIEFAALSDPTLIPQAIVSVLHIREEQNRTLLQTLCDHLRIKKNLIVLDNCEHLVDACAKIADALLRACPQIKILATSRESLGIEGEKTVRVPSLTLPDIKNLPAPETFGAYEAIHLFTDRVSAIQPNFQITATNAFAVAQICHRLDGIPLAIELAAARVKALGIEQIAARLDDRFRLLTGGSRTALPRQQTLRALMDWSHDLLLEKERVLLRRLAVFAGGWTLEAAEEICRGEPIAQKEILDLQIGLVDKSLVNLDDPSAETRYQMLETVRQYALNKLIESGEAEALRERHLDYFLAYTEKVEPQLKSKGADQALGMKALEVEHENLRAALEWSQNETGGAEKGLRLSGALGQFWERKNALTEGREWLRKFLPLADPTLNPTTYPRALSLAGRLARLRGDHDDAIEQYEKRLHLAETQGDTLGLAETHRELGLIFYRRGDYATAIDHLQRAIKIGESINDQNLVALAQMRLGMIYYEHGDIASALESHEQSLAYFQRTNQPIYVAASLGNLARIYYLWTDYDQAIENYLQVIQMYQGLEDTYSLCLAYINLSEVYIDQSNFTPAISYLDLCMKIAEESGYDLLRAMALGDLAASELGRRDVERALEFVSRALKLIKNVQAKAQEGFIYRTRGEILAALGRGEEAKLDYEAARRLLEPIQRKPELARLYRSYGMLLVADAKTHAEGADYVKSAGKLFESLGSRKEVERTRMCYRKLIEEPNDRKLPEGV